MCSFVFFRLAVGDCEDKISVAHLKPQLASGPVEPALSRPPCLKPQALLPAFRRRCGRRKKDPLLLLLQPVFVVVDLLISTLLPAP